MKGLLVLLLAFFFCLILSSVFLPQLAEVFVWFLSMFWVTFKEFFLADTVRTCVIAAIIALLFGSISAKKRSLIVALIGAVIELVLLFAKIHY